MIRAYAIHAPMPEYPHRAPYLVVMFAELPDRQRAKHVVIAPAVCDDFGDLVLVGPWS